MHYLYNLPEGGEILILNQYIHKIQISLLILVILVI